MCSCWGRGVSEGICTGAQSWMALLEGQVMAVYVLSQEHKLISQAFEGVIRGISPLSGALRL